jgi:hypothetical protein
MIGGRGEGWSPGLSMGSPYFGVICGGFCGPPAMAAASIFRSEANSMRKIGRGMRKRWCRRTFPSSRSNPARPPQPGRGSGVAWGRCEVAPASRPAGFGPVCGRTPSGPRGPCGPPGPIGDGGRPEIFIVPSRRSGVSGCEG